MKRILVYMIVVSLIFCMASDMNLAFSEEPLNFNTEKISESLLEKAINLNGQETISVSVDLAKGIDIDQIEQKVLKATDISQASMTDFYEESCAPMGTPVNPDSVKWDNLESMQDVYLKTKRALVKEYYNLNAKSFLSKYDITVTDNLIFGRYSPYIDNVQLTVEQISEMSYDETVIWLSPYEGESTSPGNNMGYISQNRSEDEYYSIRGNMAYNEGYTGSGLKIGMIEQYNPSTGVFGTNNVIVENRHGITSSNSHAGFVADVIFTMVPNCKIYSCALGEGNTNHDNISADIEYMIDTYDLDLINISYGRAIGNGDPNKIGMRIDNIISESHVTICVATGNVDPFNISYYSSAANTIAVGAVHANGRNQAATNAYTIMDGSAFRDGPSFINKPDISAPCDAVYLYESGSGTSFACPYVTGTVAQMMSRNPAMKIYPESLKAAVMASATFNAGLPAGTQEIEGTIVSDKEGAGVVDAGFCLQVAGNGRRTEHTFTSNGSWNTNIYCDTTDKPFRVAVAWNVTYDSNGNMLNPEINIRLRKNGVMVASSGAYSNRVVNELDPSFSYTGLCTNYEIIELSPEDLAEHGAGYYELYITKSGTMGSEGSVRVGAAWEQY